jgi:predicted GNAT superfamily acetyltransferase
MDYLLKYTSDIILAYENAFNVKIDMTYSNLMQLNNLYTDLIQDILNSYYFKNTYKNFEIFNEEDNYHKKLIKKIKVNNYLKITPFYRENTYFEKKQTINILKDNNKLIEELIKIDNFYSLIFEKDKIKQNINLSKKYDLKFSIVDSKNDFFKEIIEKYNKSIIPVNLDKTSNNIRYINEQMNEINMFSYLDFTYLKNRKFIIAHNENQIAGIAVLNPYSNHLPSFNKEKFPIKEKMIYNSLIVVSNEFRGRKLGLRLFKEIINYAKENKLIIFRSVSTSDGRSYLKNNIDREVIYEDQVPIISAKYELEIFERFKSIFANVSVDDYKYGDLYKNLARTFNTINSQIYNLDKKYLSIDNIKDYLMDLKLEIEAKEIIKNAKFELMKNNLKTKKNVI